MSLVTLQFNPTDKFELEQIKAAVDEMLEVIEKAEKEQKSRLNSLLRQGSPVMPFDTTGDYK